MSKFSLQCSTVHLLRNYRKSAVYSYAGSAPLQLASKRLKVSKIHILRCMSLEKSLHVASVNASIEQRGEQRFQPHVERLIERHAF